ncbi:PGF-pre-PGF domain-containing protein [Halorubrum sp. PV6]|uniref:PGF-pre-PGF domain-containing protein n=1 Tax=Halorubrum sp. PV6 TaxID=634157 RepID=UPI000F85A8DA|nr:PGF-pre-PGF domain-containing protein [Halorubrum sp. PV6]AZQ13524.1 hypothetical protein DOS48_01080 [Halorubrum sp. PV6]
MNRQRIGTVLVALLMVTAVVAVPGAVAAQEGPESPPASYYGTVTFDGEQPSTDIVIEAEVDGDIVDSVAVEEGEYGGPGVLDEKLLVGSDSSVDSGTEVRFLVSGDGIARTEAANTDPSPVEYESGAVQQVNLTFGDVPEVDDGNDEGTDGVGSTPGGDGGDSTPGGDGSDGASGGDGGDAPETSPTDEPSVDDVIQVPAGANAVASEAATAQPSADGESSRVEFTGETGVEGIEFGGAVEGDVGVAGLDGPPESAGQPPGTGVSVVEITVPEQAQDTPATIRTRVSADRLAETDADAEDLRLSRYSDGEWQALETTVAERDGDDVVLAAETPGFSVFAVSAVSQPEAAITVGSDEVAPGETVSLSGERSSDKYGEITAYDWTIDGEAATGSVTETAFAESGEYDVELTVTNDAGETDTTTATVAVESAETGDSDGEGEAEPVEEPGLFSLGTLGAVVGALVLALLVVAAVRRADR